MTEVRTAIIGVGRIGLTHAEALAHRTHGAGLVAVTTSSAEDGRATVAVSLAATRSIRDCAPVEVRLHMSPETGPRGKPLSPKEGHLRRNEQA